MYFAMVAVCEAEDDVEHDGKADGCEGEGTGADEFDELVAALFAEDARDVCFVRMEDGGGGHWRLLCLDVVRMRGTNNKYRDPSLRSG